ncbi:hypothetical protein D3C75_1077920 [compost metagenome]
MIKCSDFHNIVYTAINNVADDFYAGFRVFVIRVKTGIPVVIELVEEHPYSFASLIILQLRTVQIRG